jgi:hypothetical protein
MSVILTSTGVTFPDATTQTTAAGAASLVSVASGSFTGVNSVNVSCVSSTYNNYCIVMDGLQCSAGNQETLCMRIITSTGTYTSSYNYQSSTGGSFWLTGVAPYYYTDAPTRGTSDGTIIFVSFAFPRVTPGGNMSAKMTYTTDGSNGVAGRNWGTWGPGDTSAGSITGFNFFGFGGTNYTAGTYRIYGVKGS